MGRGIQSSELSQTQDLLTNPTHAKVSLYAKRVSFWLLNYGSTDETGRHYVNVDKSWSLLHKVYTNNPEEWKWTVNAHLRNKAKSGKLLEGIEDDKAVIIFISQIRSRGISNDFDPFNFTWQGTGFESDLSNFFIDSFPSQFLRFLQDLYPKEVEVQKAADIAGKILSVPMKIDQLQRDNPLKMTEPWFRILTTHNVKELPPPALEEVIRGVKNNLVKAAPNHRYENSDAQVLCQHLPNGKLVFHNTSAQILNKVQAQLNKENETRLEYSDTFA